MFLFVPRKPLRWRLLSVLGLVALCGCSSLDLRKTLFLSADDKPKVPVSMVDVWSDEVLTQPGMPSIRGFGGRIMFYGEDGKKPVIVDGTYSVYAFDEADRDTGYTTPEKKFVYLPEHLPKYYSKSELGHSYSFWLPWDEVSGPERRITLIARFEPKKGPVVVSKPCTKTLPGVSAQAGRPKNSLRVATRTSPDPVRQASHEEPVQGQRPPEQMTTFTLDVPLSLARPDPSPPTGKPATPGGIQVKPADPAPPPSTAAVSAPAPIARRRLRETTLARGLGRRLHRQGVSHRGDSRLKEEQLLDQGPIPFGGNLSPQCGSPRCHRHLDPIGRVKSRQGLQASNHRRVELRRRLRGDLESDDQPRLIRPLGAGGHPGSREVHLASIRGLLGGQVLRRRRDDLRAARLCSDELRRVVRTLADEVPGTAVLTPEPLRAGEHAHAVGPRGLALTLVLLVLLVWLILWTLSEIDPGGDHLHRVDPDLQSARAGRGAGGGSGRAFRRIDSGRAIAPCRPEARPGRARSASRGVASCHLRVIEGKAGIEPGGQSAESQVATPLRQGLVPLYDRPGPGARGPSGGSGTVSPGNRRCKGKSGVSR